jgi:hypothetical protein
VLRLKLVAHVKSPSITERFLDFLRSHGAEIVDELDLTPEQAKAEKADFFLDGRAVVGELKSLETDTAPKIERLMEAEKERPEWPVFYGEWPLSKVLRLLPNGEALGRKLAGEITSGIAEAVRKANRQVRETKSSFGLDDSEGLLVILNETIDILDLRQVVNAVGLALRKRNPDGTLQYPHLSAALILDEAHTIPATAMAKAGPLGPMTLRPAGIVMNESTKDGSVSVRAAEALIKGWAERHGAPTLNMAPEALPHLPLVSAKPAPVESGGMSRSDWWRHEYRMSRHLGKLSKAELLEHGAGLMENIPGGFFKGGPPVTEAEMLITMQRWTHFLEEMSIRGIDMRELGEALRTTGARERLHQRISGYRLG